MKIKNIKSISIVGSNDGLATSDSINASRELLPADTQFITIEGGNHAQFGSYGLQAGDNPASISAEEQSTQAAALTVDFLFANVP